MKGETNTWLKHGDTLAKQGDTQGAVVGYRYYYKMLGRTIRLCRGSSIKH